MVGSKPEDWRKLTPIFSILNFLGLLAIGIIGFFLIRLINQFDSHLEKQDKKIEFQEARIVRLEVIEGIKNHRKYSSIIEE